MVGDDVEVENLGEEKVRDDVEVLEGLKVDGAVTEVIEDDGKLVRGNV